MQSKSDGRNDRRCFTTQSLQAATTVPSGVKGQRFYAVAQDGGVHDFTLRLADAVKLDWFSLKEKQ